MSRRDRQLEAAQNRLKTERQQHEKTVAAKNALIETSQTGLLFELRSSFPNLQGLVEQLWRAHQAASPLKSPSWDGRRSPEPKSPMDTAAPQTRDRSRSEWINRKLAQLAESIDEDMGGKGRLVDDEIPQVSRPQCFNPACPARFRHQPFDLEICVECKSPFTEFRAPDTKDRCWKRECARQLGHRGHTGACP